MPNRNRIKDLLMNFLMPAVYLFFLLLLINTGTLPNFQALTSWQITISAIIILAGGLLLASYYFLPWTLSIEPHAETLVSSGPYRYFRHPAYLTTTLICFCLSLLVNSTAGFWYTLLVITPIIFGRAKMEQQLLKEVFGQEYREYLKKTWI